LADTGALVYTADRLPIMLPSLKPTFYLYFSKDNHLKGLTVYLKRETEAKQKAIYHDLKYMLDLKYPNGQHLSGQFYDKCKWRFD
jgi:hypothetical protein